ncbi:hypothetical protein Tco_0629265 [Tanacetum coccineum]|uniref:Uncharacterized protein n=1 Tax=Tanacetum coccineum TaxID=301880 RepID=A0ABQ4WSQ4_9ASTR
MDTELMKESSKKAKAEIAQESSSKRAGEALEQESSKKQKVDDDKETEELKQCIEIISDDGDDVTIKATPLSTKYPTIVDYKIYKKGKKTISKLFRARFKARFKKTEPVNYMDTFLHLNLKTMFEHHLEDNVWKNQQGLVKVLNWKLYDSCGVHCVTMQNILYYLLVEKMIKSLLEVTAVKVCVTADKHKLVLLVILIGIKRLLSVVEVTAAGYDFYCCNSRVTCEDEAKRRNSGAKTKTFEENCYLLLYVVSNKEDTAYQR